MKHRLRSRFHLLLPAVLILALFWRTPVGAQSVEEGKDAALAHAADLDGLVAQMSNRLWDFAEIALEEHQSAGYLAELLEGRRTPRQRAGFRTGRRFRRGSRCRCRPVTRG